MTSSKDKKPAGIIAASITPMMNDFSPNYDAIPLYLDYLAKQGCHGALILGTTGEGPSFAFSERIAIFRASAGIRQTHPDFILLAGTGTPSMQETIDLNRAVFKMGFDGVVVLPPYFFRNAGEDGLFTWFENVIRKSVPIDGILLGYHIPAIANVPLSMSLLKRLKVAFPHRFEGIKDSSGNPERIPQFHAEFGNKLSYFTGNDRLLSQTLKNSGSGMISALSNITGRIARTLWQSYHVRQPYQPLQEQLTQARTILEAFPPYAPSIKAILNRLYGFPLWPVRPPLEPLSEKQTDELCEKIAGYLI